MSKYRQVAATMFGFSDLDSAKAALKDDLSGVENVSGAYHLNQNQVDALQNKYGSIFTFENLGNGYYDVGTNKAYEKWAQDEAARNPYLTYDSTTGRLVYGGNTIDKTGVASMTNTERQKFEANMLSSANSLSNALGQISYLGSINGPGKEAEWNTYGKAAVKSLGEQFGWSEAEVNELTKSKDVKKLKQKVKENV